MEEKVKTLPTANIWRFLFRSAIALGILMALFEVCWTYLLPVFFPNRRYELPISTAGFFALIALVIDVFLMLIGSFVVGSLIFITRKASKRARSFGHWQPIAHFVLIWGALSYLCVGIIYSYYTFGSEKLKFYTGVASLSLLVPISLVIVWLLSLLVRRFGKAVPTIIWIFVCVILVSVTVPNYLRYRSERTVDMDLPTKRVDRVPHILFVTIDTLRADHLACYGNKVVKTPVLDALADDGCLFEAAFAQAPTTTPSHCSIMTSTYVARNEALNGCAMKPGLPTLAEILRANGYKTGAFVSATTVRSTNSGLHRGFDYYEDSISAQTTIFRHDEYQFILLAYLFVRLQHSQIPGYVVTERALSWLERQEQEPFFLWLHYFDPHDPYDAPSPYKDMYNGKVDPDLPCVLERSRYAGEITYTDSQLGHVLKVLKDKGLYDEMLIIVTSDHGEAFGESHGDITEYKHGHYLYDTTQHVPLIVKMPIVRQAGRRIKEVVELIDLAPTVVDYLQAKQPKSFQGSSLLDLLEGEHHSVPKIAYSERTIRLPSVGQFPEYPRMMAMRNSQIKYICEAGGQGQELYDIVSDPAETTNLFLDRPELAKECYGWIKDSIGDPGQASIPSFDPKIIEELKSLGYID